MLMWRPEFTPKWMVVLNQRNEAATRLPSRRRSGESARKASSQGTAASPVQVGVKLQLDLPVGSRIGPGKIQLLELIETQGSLSRAAESMGLSYRRAWQFVQHVNAAFDQPAIATPENRHGGAPARLTEFGKELIRRYRRLEELTAAHGDEDLHWLARHQRQK
jgi:molybdate transport system regulatory protein